MDDQIDPRLNIPPKSQLPADSEIHFDGHHLSANGRRLEPGEHTIAEGGTLYVFQSESDGDI
jgi:hypothetical protein